MTHMNGLTYAPSKTPKAGAVAGILFAVLLIVVFWLLRRSVPADPREPGSWLRGNSEAVALALNLVPFAGMAFLWFIGVLRDRLGEAEDRFFATVFFGSGVLYLGMLFSAAALSGALMLAFAAQPEEFINSATFHFARAAAYSMVNIYLAKMASVFMMTTSTVAIYTGLTSRWLAFLGYGMSLFLLFGSYYFGWGFIIFPLWVLAVSVHILLDNIRRRSP
jgi:hypothetical protein